MKRRRICCKCKKDVTDINEVFIGDYRFCSVCVYGAQIDPLSYKVRSVFKNMDIPRNGVMIHARIRLPPEYLGLLDTMMEISGIPQYHPVIGYSNVFTQAIELWFAENCPQQGIDWERYCDLARKRLGLSNS